MSHEDVRLEVLNSFGATPAVRDALLAYNRNRFDHAALTPPVRLPLSDEPFVAAWETYEREARQGGAFRCLKHRLVQLNFPIRDGISKMDGYRAATRKGVPWEGIPAATGLKMQQPQTLQLILHPTPAGRIPILITKERADFVSLVRALAMKNEPGPVPDSMGAVTVSGYNNWDRIRELREAWESCNPDDILGTGWADAFSRIIPQKERYQDRFIILSHGPYSGVPALRMGLTEAEWAHKSLTIRMAHECAHYFTKRVFSSMKNLLMDEMMADYMGITAAAGKFRSDWFLRFVGLEDFPNYRSGGRLENYRGDPRLSDAAFRILQLLVKRAAENLETFDSKHRDHQQASGGRAVLLTTLTFLTLEELASNRAFSLLERAFRRSENLLVWN